MLKCVNMTPLPGCAGPNYQNYAVEAPEFFKAQQGAFLQKGSAGWFQWVRQGQSQSRTYELSIAYIVPFQDHSSSNACMGLLADTEEPQQRVELRASTGAEVPARASAVLPGYAALSLSLSLSFAVALAFAFAFTVTFTKPKPQPLAKPQPKPLALALAHAKSYPGESLSQPFSVAQPFPIAQTVPIAISESVSIAEAEPFALAITIALTESSGGGRGAARGARLDSGCRLPADHEARGRCAYVYRGMRQFWQATVVGGQ